MNIVNLNRYLIYLYMRNIPTFVHKRIGIEHSINELFYLLFLLYSIYGTKYYYVSEIFSLISNIQIHSK